MRIEVKGRNLPVNDELREHVEKRFQKIAKQVSDLAVLEIEVSKERNPANPGVQVAEATLHLKGVTLRAKDASPDLNHSVNLVRRGARPPGQAPPRQAPQAPRVARRRGRASCAGGHRRSAPGRSASARGFPSGAMARPGRSQPLHWMA